MGRRLRFGRHAIAHSKAARVNIFEISGTHKYLSEGTFSINVSLLERPSGQVLAKSGDLVSGDPSLVAKLATASRSTRCRTSTPATSCSRSSSGPRVSMSPAADHGRRVHRDHQLGRRCCRPEHRPVRDQRGRDGRRAAHRITTPANSSRASRCGTTAAAFSSSTCSPRWSPMSAVRSASMSSGLVYDPTGELFVGELNITNIGSFDLNGPFYVLFDEHSRGRRAVQRRDHDRRGSSGHQDRSEPAACPATRCRRYRCSSATRTAFPSPIPSRSSTACGPSLWPRPGWCSSPIAGRPAERVEYVALGADYAIGLAGGSRRAAVARQCGERGRRRAHGMGRQQRRLDAAANGSAPGREQLHHRRAAASPACRTTGACITTRSTTASISSITAAKAGWNTTGSSAPAPTSRPSPMRFRGVDQITADSAGNLLLRVGGSELIQRAPVAYQLIGGERRSVATRFEMRPDGTIGFAVENYDRSATADHRSGTGLLDLSGRRGLAVMRRKRSPWTRRAIHMSPAARSRPTFPQSTRSTMT